MAGSQYVLNTTVSLPLCSTQTSLEKGLGVGEKNSFSEGDSISVSDQRLCQVKASREG